MTPPGGIHADPEQLFRIAGSVLGDPWQLMARAQQTASAHCSMPENAFGVLPGSYMSPSYNAAQNAMAGSIGQAADLIHSMGTALADVAQTYGSVEQANTLTPPTVTLPDTGLGSSSNADTMIGEDTTVGTMAALFAYFAAIAGVCGACAVLTPAALVSVAAWALTEPVDEAITGAISGWQSATLDVANCKNALDDIVNNLDDGWDRDDSARPAFDRWFRQFDDDLDQLKDSVGQFPDKLQDALQEIHTIHTGLFIAACVSLAALVTLTAADAFFGVGEAAKLAEAVGLNANVWVSIVSVVTVLVTTAGFLVDLGNKSSGFSVTNPGSHALPRFDQVAVDWDPLHQP